MKSVFRHLAARLRALTTGQRILVALVLALVTLWGGSKESGQRTARLADNLATASLRTGGTATLRALPGDLAENTNALKIIAFAIDLQNRELAFEVAWASNLFDAADSRNLHLFSATNLNARQWAPLGAFAMPSGTNACAFVIDCSKTPHQFWYWDESTRNPVWTKKEKGCLSW